MKNDHLIRDLLAFLSVERSEANLEFLNKLIENYQKKVKWETLTKIIDWEEGGGTGEYLPSAETVFERVIHKGMGGTCWTHSIGFHWLLSNLGFSVHYVYMDPGHLCLRVDLDQAYYVDVGFGAPLFQAYPMFESFQAEDQREVFKYIVSDETIRIEREPGPIKTLSPKPVTLQDLQHVIRRSNDWETAAFIREISIFGYIDDVPVSLKNNKLKQHFESGKLESELSEEETEYWITERFGIDKSLYDQAVDIHKRMLNSFIV